MAADRAGAHEKAVRSFLTLAEKDPVATAHLFPDSLSSATAGTATRFLQWIENALADQSLKNRSLVEYLRYDARRKISGEADSLALATDVAGRHLPAQLMTDKAAAIKAAAMEQLLQAGRGTEIIASIDTSLADLPAELMPAFLLLKSRALMSIAADADGYMEAALPAMRVAIHFADTPTAGEGLLLAAFAHEQAGYRDDAIRLLRRCLSLEAASDDAKDRAHQSIRRLTARENGEPGQDSESGQGSESAQDVGNDANGS
jgi:hypothetical protein